MILVDPINEPVQTQMIFDANVIIANSNHSTGPSSSSSSSFTNAGSDHKMIPAAIGSERKRHMPLLTTVGPMPKLVVLVIGLPFQNVRFISIYFIFSNLTNDEDASVVN